MTSFGYTTKVYLLNWGKKKTKKNKPVPLQE
jgi:hypothetical protein